MVQRRIQRTEFLWSHAVRIRIKLKSSDRYQQYHRVGWPGKHIIDRYREGTTQCLGRYEDTKDEVIQKQNGKLTSYLEGFSTGGDQARMRESKDKKTK